jgi:hypothetical protein
MAFLDFLSPDSLDAVKEQVASFAGLARLLLTSWVSGQPGEQLYQAFSRAMQASGMMNAAAIRGMFLDYATDPGDYDPYNPENINLPPTPGYLSALMLNVFFTERRGETYATTTLRLTNSGGSTHYIAPEALTLARSGHPEITYRNSADASVYVDVGGTKRLSPGAYVDLEIVAESPGSGSNAAAGEITVLVSSLIGVTVSNAAAAIGEDREAAPAARARAREQATSTSPNGAADKYRYYATTQLGGAPLLRNDGSEAAVGITKIWVSPFSSTGVVDVYYADDDGPADATDVASANENIVLRVVAPGDCITFGPTPDGGDAATATPVVVTWAVKYQATYQGRPVAGADVKAAIVAALTARFTDVPIGGFDQVSGAGTLYVSDLRGTVDSAHPAIYSTTLSAPAGDVAITLGHVAVLTTPTGTETAG